MRDSAARQQVRQRSGDRCEFCRLPQEHSALRFHIDHIATARHGGSDALENLALACPECNLHKGTNLSGIDPDTGEVTRLFNPRSNKWKQHFASDGARLIGKTAEGRTTVWLLEMNTGSRLLWREMLFGLGLWK